MMLSTTETTAVEGRNSTAPHLLSLYSDLFMVKVRNTLGCASFCSDAAAVQHEINHR